MKQEIWLYGPTAVKVVGALNTNALSKWVTIWNQKNPGQPVLRKRGWYEQDSLLSAWAAPRDPRGGKRGVPKPRKVAQK